MPLNKGHSFFCRKLSCNLYSFHILHPLPIQDIDELRSRYILIKNTQKKTRSHMIKTYLSLFERDGILILSFASLTEYSVTSLLITTLFDRLTPNNDVVWP